MLLPYPIVLIPREKSVYFVPPETFNLVTMMSNPMMLLMVLGGGMMLAMPYLMVGSVFPFLSVDRFAQGSPHRKTWNQTQWRTSRNNKEGSKVHCIVGT